MIKEQNTILKTKWRSTVFTLLLFFGLSSGLSAQNITVTGTVSSSDGETVPMASVVVQGTSKAVVSDALGKYSIDVSKDATLIFSGTGFISQVVPVANRPLIDVVLNPDNELLDEVVVVGYGTIRKSHLTGSVAKIENKILDQIPLGRVDDALSGQITGVTIQQTNPAAGEAPTIRVRGQGSISFDSDPLIVLDGIVVGNDGDFLSSLDMNDVASVEVLKDASSGAIYGSRGANGIIMITTKKGVEGPTKFSYNTYVGFKDVPSNDVLSTPSEWADFVRENNNGELTDRMKYIEQLGNYTNWEDVMFDGGMITSNAISARGGTKNTKFTASVSHLNDQGVLLTDNFEKLNFRINLTTKLRERIQFGVNLNPSHTEQRRFPIGVHDAIRQAPWTPLWLTEDNIGYVNRYRENGRWSDVKVGDYAMERMFDDYDLENGMPDPNMSGTDISTTSNQGSLAKVLERDRRKYQTKVYANTFLKYQITDALSFKQTLGGDFRYTKNREWFGIEATRNGAADSRSNRSTDIRWHSVSESTLNFDKEWGDQTLNAVAGFAFEKWQTEQTILTSAGFSNDLIQTIPGANLTGGEMVEFEESLLSYLSRVNYTLKDRYLLTASVRTDGSSKFGPDTKYGIFPAVSAGWMVSQEDFFPANSPINNLKVRASYGLTGNNNGIGAYDHLGLISPFGTGFGQIGYNATNIENPNLGWEKLREINPGIDLSMWGSRFNLSLDLYQRKSEDLLLQVPVPSVTGFTTALVNRGEVENKGFELEMMTRNVNTRNFTWSTSYILTHNQNTLVDFAGAGDLISIVDGKRPAEWIARVGSPISSFYGYVVEDEIPLEYIKNPFYPINAQSQDIYVRDLNGDGVIDTDDRTILGSPYPDFVWSVTNNFKYKNFDIMVMMQGSHGAEVRNISSQYIKNEFSGNQDFTTEFPDAHLVKQRIFTSDDIQDASFISLRNLNIGYNVPTSTLKQLGVQRLRMYASAQNLLYIMAEGYEGYNPEGIDQGRGNPLTYGYQRGPAPIYRTFSLGVNLDF
jgi:TonB-linked SusC/RagA family outer membrane protein